MSTSHSRRRFLGYGSATALSALSALPGLSGRAWAAPGAADSRFLLVFLRGGYDALSAFTPPGDFIREVRPNIAVQRALPLDDGWGLHPALQDSLLPMARRGQALFVPFTGPAVATRSHFETQDRIEMGGADQGPRDTGSGFMNRLAQRLGARAALPIAFSDRLPLALQGPVEAANVALEPGARAAEPRLQGGIEDMYRGTPLEGRVRQGYQVRAEAQRDPMDNAGMSPAAAREMAAAGRGAAAAARFETEARRMARLMAARHTLGFVDIGGWDTHVAQGADDGALALRLKALGQGLAAFADEIGSAQWSRTTVMVISEFGRTVRENGSRGTDHGHGSVYWVLGGGLDRQGGGLLRGDRVAVDAARLHAGRELPVLQDVRGVLAGLLGRQFGLAPADLQAIFPQVQPRDLRLV
jgi:uncharacterized protein (DUF1501 family)